MPYKTVYKLIQLLFIAFLYKYLLATSHTINVSNNVLMYTKVHTGFCFIDDNFYTQIF